MTASQTVKIKGDGLNFYQFSAVVFKKTPVTLDNEAIKRMQASRDFVKRLIEKRSGLRGSPPDLAGYAAVSSILARLHGFNTI